MEEMKGDSGEKQAVIGDTTEKVVETFEQHVEVSREPSTSESAKTVVETVPVTNSEKPCAEMTEAQKPTTEAQEPTTEDMAEAPVLPTREEVVKLYRDAESRDSDSSTSSSSESDLEMKNDEDSDTEEVSLKKQSFPILKTPGEVLLEDLPAIQELHVTVSDDVKMEEAGVILNIIGVLVIVQSTGSRLRPLDEATIFFLEDRTVLGQVYETFGPVSGALYQVRFNSVEEIEQRNIKPGLTVYHAPDHSEFTRYVFLNQLQQKKGSDASWENNNEPPATCVEYSDDEEERNARKNAKAVRRLKKDEGKEGKEEKDGEKEKAMTQRQKKRQEYRSRGRGRGQGQGGRGRGHPQNWDEPNVNDDTCSLDCWPPKPRHFKDSSYVNPRFRPPMPPPMMPAQSQSIVSPGAAFTPPPAYTQSWYPQQQQQQQPQMVPSPMFGMFPPPPPGAFPYQMQACPPGPPPPNTGPYMAPYTQPPPPQYMQAPPQFTPPPSFGQPRPGMQHQPYMFAPRPTAPTQTSTSGPNNFEAYNTHRN